MSVDPDVLLDVVQMFFFLLPLIFNDPAFLHIFSFSPDDFVSSAVELNLNDCFV